MKSCAPVLLLILMAMTRAIAAEPVVMSLEDFINFQRSKDSLILDVRPPADYQRGHVPGALNLPLGKFDTAYESLRSQLEADRNRKIAVYCVSPICSDSAQVADRLARIGYPNVFLFRGGYAAWWKARMPKESYP